MTELFGPYRVINEVASGSLGRVYRTRHTELGRYAAVKELSPAVRGVPGQAARLRAEAATLAALSHPNVVALYDYVEEPARTWLAEQWVDGATLAEIMREHGPLTPEQALGVVAGAVTGLAHAHDHGIVHRDISCTNILADLAGTSMLVDFGIAAPATTGAGSGPEETVIGGLGNGSITGTPAYLSPEAARGEPLAKTSDVYSVAAVLFHLLTGAPPFTGPAAQVVGRHRDEPAPRLRGHGPELEALVARSLSKVPAERPADATAFLAELEQAATRRYGVDWRTRASIAGLVGAAAAVAGGSTTVAGSAPAAETVFVDTGLARSVAQTATRAGRPVSKIVLVAGGVVTAVVVGAGAVAVTRGNDGSTPAATDDAPKVSASSSPTPTEEPPDPVVVSAPSGRWRLVSTVVKSNNPGVAKVGRVTNRRTWVVKSRCPSATSCGGKITSSSGNSFDYTWDGSSMSIDNGGTNVDQGLCADVETDELVPGTHYKQTVRSSPVTLRAAGGRGSDGMPTRLVGDQRTQVTVTELRGECTNAFAETGSPTPTYVERFVVTVR